MKWRKVKGEVRRLKSAIAEVKDNKATRYTLTELLEKMNSPKKSRLLNIYKERK